VGPTTTTLAATTSTATTTTPTEPDIVVTRDVVYHEPIEGGNPLLLDVYAPATEGPHPVVITYHGDARVNTKASMEGLARYLAARGMVVYNVTWGGPGMSLRSRILGDSACSYWYAATDAPSHGGDPDAISLVGFSGGASKASAIAFLPMPETDLCAADPVAVTPASLVLFEGGQGLNPWLDDDFRADDTLFNDAFVWNKLDAYTGGPIHLLVDRKTEADPFYWASNLIRPPTTSPDESLELRDPALATDLEAIGAFEDGEITFTEVSELLEYRLRSAGIPTSLTWIDSASHTMTIEAMQAIGDILLDS
jgi:acetyl esterase/lipase